MLWSWLLSRCSLLCIDHLILCCSNSAGKSKFSNSASFSFVLLVNVNSKQNRLLLLPFLYIRSWHCAKSFVDVALHASFCQLEMHRLCAFLVYDGVTPVNMLAHSFPALVGTKILLCFEDLVSVASNQQSLLAAPSCLLDIEPAASTIYMISDQWDHSTLQAHARAAPCQTNSKTVSPQVETNDTSVNPPLHALLALVPSTAQL